MARQSIAFLNPADLLHIEEWALRILRVIMDQLQFNKAHFCTALNRPDPLLVILETTIESGKNVFVRFRTEKQRPASPYPPTDTELTEEARFRKAMFSDGFQWWDFTADPNFHTPIGGNSQKALVVQNSIDGCAGSDLLHLLAAKLETAVLPFAAVEMATASIADGQITRDILKLKLR